VKELPKAYDPQQVEPRWAEHWAQKPFAADPKSNKPPFVIVMPPPNVTGVLHMGHALDNALQDALTRYKRMSGYEALWLPGTDHAGIATQVVVERLLAKEGKSRHDLGREKFLERVWQWREESGGQILEQLKRLGASADWSRLAFTMDETRSRAVRYAFVRSSRRSDLPRRTTAQLVPSLRNDAFGPRGQQHPHPGNALHHRLPARRRRRDKDCDFCRRRHRCSP